MRLFRHPLIAALGLTSVALVSQAGAAPTLSAGETARTTATASAATRNRGDGAIRILVWYPSTAAETPVDLGPPERPIFKTGAVANGGAPADGRRHALILMSHGFGGTARQMAWLGTPLARLGYIVVAVDHPGTNGQDGVTAQGAYAPWARADDLSAALDAVMADPVIAPHIDIRRVGVAGYALGGFTSVLLAGARPDFDHLLAFCHSPTRDAICEPQQEYPVDFDQQAAVLAQPDMAALAQDKDGDFRDRRIKAAFLIAPALGQALDPDSLKGVRIPVQIVAGDADVIVPDASNAKVIAALIPGTVLTNLPSVGHYDFLSLCGPGGAKLSYCVDGAGTKRTATHAATVAQAAAFFARNLEGPP